MLSQSDKVTITQYPALPSLCRVCNFSADGNREFVDFQLSFDIDGAINICTFCMVNIVQALGFIDPSEAQGLMDRISTLLETNKELAENNARLNTTLDSILGVRPDLVRDRLLSDEVADQQSDDSLGQLTLAFEGDSDSIESESAGESDSSSGNDESESERGPEDVSKSTGNKRTNKSS